MYVLAANWAAGVVTVRGDSGVRVPSSILVTLSFELLLFFSWNFSEYEFVAVLVNARHLEVGVKKSPDPVEAWIRTTISRGNYPVSVYFLLLNLLFNNRLKYKFVESKTKRNLIRRAWQSKITNYWNPFILFYCSHQNSCYFQKMSSLLRRSCAPKTFLVHRNLVIILAQKGNNNRDNSYFHYQEMITCNISGTL